MFLYLTDRGCRLGQNILNYIAQILFCHKNNYIIKFRNNSKENYRYFDSIFVKILFNYIDKHNEELYKMNINDTEEFIIKNNNDFISLSTSSLKSIKCDFITYFNNHIYNHVISDFKQLTTNYHIPFDVNKTILVHLRLDDVIDRNDYDGSECSEYYKKKILNNEDCFCELYDRVNKQAPLSKYKLVNIINKAKRDFPDHKVILLTSPNSDTSFLNYPVIKNIDENLDLYLLTMCNVSILSRSTYALVSLFFNNNKNKTYIPLWGHFVCCGLDTIYDNNDKNKIRFFY
jgi:hypothetical protein